MRGPLRGAITVQTYNTRGNCIARSIQAREDLRGCPGGRSRLQQGTEGKLEGGDIDSVHVHGAGDARRRMVIAG